MSRRISLQARIDAFLAERRRLGFKLHSWDTLLSGFARYVASQASPRSTDRRADGGLGTADKNGWKSGDMGAHLEKVRHLPAT